MSKVKGVFSLKSLVKGVCVVLVFGTIALLLWRMFSSGDPKSMKTLDANKVLWEAYQAAEAEGREMDMFVQHQKVTTTNTKTNYNYFTVSNAVFIRDADQVQLTFRYNNQTLRHLAEDYDLSEPPDRDEDVYEVTLWVVYDRTPDVAEDAEESEEYVRIYPTAAETKSERKNLYNYRKFVFDGVEMTSDEKTLITVYMDVYYVGDVNYDVDPYGTLPLYQYKNEVKDGWNEAYILTAADRKALEAFTE